jgi:hypothetical protein
MKITKPKVTTLILVCASVFLIGQTTPMKDYRTTSPTYGKWLYKGKAYVKELKPWGNSVVGGWMSYSGETGQPIQRQRPLSLEERVVILERTVRNLQAEVEANNRTVSNLNGTVSNLNLETNRLRGWQQERINRR